MDLAATVSRPRLSSLVSALAFAGSAAVAGLFALYVATGIGQDALQVVSTPADYAAILLHDPAALKVVLGLDNLFILSYLPMFIVLGAVLQRSAPRAILIAAVALLIATGILDLLENMHFRTLLGSAELGIAIPQGAIDLQVWESLVKFHLSYVGLFLLSFALPCETALEKTVCFAFRWLQAPIGILIYVVPAAAMPPLLIGRFGFFCVALLAIGAIFRRRSGSDAPA
jgi:hypothetical protein